MMTIEEFTPNRVVADPNDTSEFERLLNISSQATKPGELVIGTVTAVERDSVRVDVGFKSEGNVPMAQFLGADGKCTVSVGDKVEVLLVAPENEEGEIVISKDRAEQYRVWVKLEDVFKRNENVKGRVVQKVKGGLQVDIGVPAFLPGSQIDVRPQRNLDRYLGEEMEFKILKFSRQRGNIVLSRRVVLEEERKALKQDTLGHISEGVVMEGTVKNITDYGAFIDLGGIDGLLHITDMSWGRVNHPSEILTPGQVVPVVVLKYDTDKERVSLGMKQLHNNPWDHVEMKYVPGNTVTGKVMSIADYGAFIKLEDGVEGLIHVSEMTWSKKTKHPNKLLNAGDDVTAQILEVNAKQQRISLGLKQLLPNPWESLQQEFPAGTKITGAVRSVTDFGIFVTVKDGIDGLVHVSDISWTKRVKDPKELQDLYKKGETVEAVVLEIDQENERLSLGIKQLTPDIWDTVPHRYPAGAKVRGKINSVTEFGVFVELEEGVEGLIHISQLGLQKGDNHYEKFKVGDEIESEVTNVDKAERRISLSLKPAKRASKQKEDYAQYLDESAGSATFRDIFEQIKTDK
ncbi:30S ribosomal protein S1 [bacterium]|nr:30S ribosomal protein S1 [bacterium]